MGMKRRAAEAAVWLAGCAVRSCPIGPDPPRSIFVLRNNDLGDLLVITPLFDALHRLFPRARIAAGVGAWNVETLAHNPYVDEIIEVNAPWHNRVTAPAGPRDAIRYLMRSPEIKHVADGRFDVGIDILGSVFGSLLMIRTGIPTRLGVRGYAGGHTATQLHIDYNPGEHVGRAALRFAELLGATDLPDVRPQLFLSARELDDAEARWQAVTRGAPARRVVIAPGGGHPGRAWPIDHFLRLGARLAASAGIAAIAIGGETDRDAGARLAALGIATFTARLTLRQSFSTIARSELVICNSSFAMHAAAACGVPAIVLLGSDYPSAVAHAAQWGHGPLSIVLGREPNRAEIYSPDEVLRATAAHPCCASVLGAVA